MRKKEGVLKGTGKVGSGRDHCLLEQINLREEWCLSSHTDRLPWKKWESTDVSFNTQHLNWCLENEGTQFNRTHGTKTVCKLFAQKAAKCGLYPQDYWQLHNCVAPPATHLKWLFWLHCLSSKILFLKFCQESPYVKRTYFILCILTHYPSSIPVSHSFSPSFYLTVSYWSLQKPRALHSHLRWERNWLK